MVSKILWGVLIVLSAPTILIAVIAVAIVVEGRNQLNKDKEKKDNEGI